MCHFDLALKGRGFSRAVSPIKSVAALEFAEELDFGWRSAFSAAIKPVFAVRALAPEGARSELSANRLAAGETCF
jgi:hypothetical protein